MTTTPLQAFGLAAFYGLMAAPAQADQGLIISGENFFQRMFTPQQLEQYFTPTKPSAVFVELLGAPTADQAIDRKSQVGHIGRIDINYINQASNQAALRFACASVLSLWLERQKNNTLFEPGATSIDYTDKNAPQTPSIQVFYGNSTFATGETTPATSFGCIGNRFVVVAPKIKEVLLFGTTLHCATPDAYQKLKANGPQQPLDSEGGGSDNGSHLAIAQASSQRLKQLQP